MKNLITRIATGITLIATLTFFFFYAQPIVTSLAMLAILIFIIIFEFTKLFNYKSLLFWLILPLYPVLPLTLAAYMCYFANYRELIFYLILLAQMQDVGGYVFGSLFGKHKLAPKLSPKKSWEGFFGGYLFTALTLTSILFIKNTFIKQTAIPALNSINTPVNTPINPYININWVIFILAFSLVISVFATAGDLLESWLKRKAGIKDTGNILPGHGGLLDRFDSCLLIIFIFFIFKDYLLKIFNI